MLKTQYAEGASVKEKQKIISVSKGRQITLPVKFYNQLGIGDEAECIMRDGEIVIRPIHRHETEFADQILADLIKEGYEGVELLNRFKEMRSKIRPAVVRMLEEAQATADAIDQSISPEDKLTGLFGSETED
jgi:bifunctional DNA-binding transcriptional regulator/antitoxin component of YhaV-PrlF toxin-antitoxin module